VPIVRCIIVTVTRIYVPSGLLPLDRNIDGTDDRVDESWEDAMAEDLVLYTNPMSRGRSRGG
jgi:hypothetical protein